MRKFVPFHQNEIGKITQWLNTLARDGLCVETWASFFVKLKLGEERDYAYQIDIDDSVTNPNYQRKLDLEKQGWQYVQTIGTSRHHIYRIRNQSAQFDWDESYIQIYQKHLRTNLIWELVIGLLYVMLYFWITVFRNGEYLLLNLVESGGYNEGILTVVIFYTVFSWSRDVAGTQRLRCWLKQNCLNHGKCEDNVNNHTTDRRIPYGLKQIIISIVLIGLVLLIFSYDNKGENFDGTQPGLACVDLQMLEVDGFSLSQITWKDNPGINFGNRILKKPGFFTEYFYEVNQYGTDANGEDVQISGSYYKFRPDSLTGAVLEQLFDRSTSYMYEHQYFDEDKKLPEDYWKVSEIENTSFETLIVAEAVEEDAPIMIFAQKGDIVIYLRYYGNLSAEVFVQELTRLYM